MVGNLESDDFCHEMNFICRKVRWRSPGAAPTNHIGVLPRKIRESHIISRIVTRPRMFQTVISGSADSSLTADHQIDDTGAVALAARPQVQFADDAFRCVVAVSKNNIHPTSTVQFHKSLFCIYISLTIQAQQLAPGSENPPRNVLQFQACEGMDCPPTPC